MIIPFYFSQSVAVGFMSTSLQVRVLILYHGEFSIQGAGFRVSSRLGCGTQVES